MNSSGSQSLHNNVHKRLLPISRRRRLNACIAAFSSVVLGSFSSLAMGLGLGEIDSRSFLGQPLNAHIELISLEGDVDLNTLIVRQVTPDEARNMGVETFYVPYRIDFTVDTSSGSPRIRVTSADPIREPYLSLMVELRWPKGVVYRDYPILLDPPPVVAERSVAQAARPTVAPKAPVAERPASTRPTSSPRPRPAQVQLEPLATDNGKYKVQRGDTLSTIAERWREGTTQSRSEVMQWLHENNSHAFANNNVNRLMAGAVLTMPDLSAYKVTEGAPTAVAPSIAPLPKSGSGEGKVTEVSAEEKSAPKTSVGEDAALVSETRGLLTVGTESRDDRTRELIDMLVRENETLKLRMEKLESSEYLDTLKQLIVLQRQQISDLRQKLGVPDSDANEEMDTLFAEIGVNRTLAADTLSAAEAQASTTQHTPVVAQTDRREAVLEMDPVIAQPVDNAEGRGWLVWLMFGAGLALSALFIGMFTYYRRMVPAKQRDSYELDRLPPVIQDHETRAEPTLSTFKPHREESKPVSLEYDGEVSPIYVHKKSEHWLGEKADSAPVNMDDETTREIQAAFEDMVLDEDVLKSFDSITETSLEGLTAEVAPAAEKTSSITEAKEKSSKADKKRNKKYQSTRRPDEEVRMSIAEKMAQYNPDEYRQEMESLGLMELDELGEIDENEEEDIETIVYRALMFCEFKKYDKARSLLEQKMQTIQDERLTAAMAQIDSMESEALKNSKKAI